MLFSIKLLKLLFIKCTKSWEHIPWRLQKRIISNCPEGSSTIYMNIRMKALWSEIVLLAVQLHLRMELSSFWEITESKIFPDLWVGSKTILTNLCMSITSRNSLPLMFSSSFIHILKFPRYTTETHPIWDSVRHYWNSSRTEWDGREGGL